MTLSPRKERWIKPVTVPTSPCSKACAISWFLVLHHATVLAVSEAPITDPTRFVFRAVVADVVTFVVAAIVLAMSTC